MVDRNSIETRREQQEYLEKSGWGGFSSCSDLDLRVYVKQQLDDDYEELRVFCVRHGFVVDEVMESKKGEHVPLQLTRAQANDMIFNWCTQITYDDVLSWATIYRLIVITDPPQTLRQVIDNFVKTVDRPPMCDFSRVPSYAVDELLAFLERDEEQS